MIIGFKARNHSQQVKARGALDDTDDRRTRAEVFDPLHAEHKFTLDVAASVENYKIPKFFTKEENGLSKSWSGQNVWCNPPYSDIRPWIEKALYETRYNDCRKVVLLLPNNRCEQSWWQELIEPLRDRPGTGIRCQFLAGRPRFDWTKDRARPVKGDRPPFGLVVIIIERPLP